MVSERWAEAEAQWAADGGWADMAAADGGDGRTAGGRLTLWVELTVRDVGELDPPQARAHGPVRRGPCALGRRCWSPRWRRRCGGADGAARSGVDIRRANVLTFGGVAGLTVRRGAAA